MFALLSGQYINPELGLHYGTLPPAFLPIGGQRFFAMQNALARSEPVLMTLPEGYAVQPSDRRLIETLGIRTLPLPPTMRLNQAILRVASEVPQGDSLRLLFGDTFVDLRDADLRVDDFAAVQETPLDYPWTYAENTADGVRFTDRPSEPGEQSAVCGYFKFSDIEALQQAFDQASFSRALSAYAAGRDMALVEAQEWYDLGHLAMFYKSRRSHLVARDFNSVASHGNSARKRSEHSGKIRAEALWYEALPKPLLLHAPRYLGRFDQDFQAGYEIEYLHLPTLSDLGVFGNHSFHTWKLILNRSLDFLQSCQAIRPNAAAPELSARFSQDVYDRLVVGKTWDRLAAFCAARGLDIDAPISVNGGPAASLGQAATEVLAALPPTRPEHITFWHGDYFFGNMFFDFAAERIMVIDPRGCIADDVPSSFGDCRYDIGKLAHSILGGYDHIIAGRSVLSKPAPFDWEFRIEFNPAHDALAAYFIDRAAARFGIGARELHGWAALMFLSMLPLHGENPARQDRLLASGLRLHALMRGL